MSVRHQSEAQAHPASSVRIVVWLGIVLLLVGIVTVLPRGLTPGGAANRNISLGGGAGGLVSTPGYQSEDEDTGRRRTIVRWLMGAVLLGAGLVCILVAG